MVKRNLVVVVVVVVLVPHSTKLPLDTALRTFDLLEESRNSDLLPTLTALGSHLEILEALES